MEKNRKPFQISCFEMVFLYQKEGRNFYEVGVCKNKSCREYDILSENENKQVKLCLSFKIFNGIWKCIL